MYKKIYESMKLGYCRWKGERYRAPQIPPYKRVCCRALVPCPNGQRFQHVFKVSRAGTYIILRRTIGLFPFQGFGPKNRNCVFSRGSSRHWGSKFICSNKHFVKENCSTFFLNLLSVHPQFWKLGLQKNLEGGKPLSLHCTVQSLPLTCLRLTWP